MTHSTSLAATICKLLTKCIHIDFCTQIACDIPHKFRSFLFVVFRRSVFGENHFYDFPQRNDAGDALVPGNSCSSSFHWPSSSGLDFGSNLSPVFEDDFPTMSKAAPSRPGNFKLPFVEVKKQQSSSLGSRFLKPSFSDFHHVPNFPSSSSSDEENDSNNNSEDEGDSYLVTSNPAANHLSPHRELSEFEMLSDGLVPGSPPDTPSLLSTSNRTSSPDFRAESPTEKESNASSVLKYVPQYPEAHKVIEQHAVPQYYEHRGQDMLEPSFHSQQARSSRFMGSFDLCRPEHDVDVAVPDISFDSQCRKRKSSSISSSHQPQSEAVPSFSGHGAHQEYPHAYQLPSNGMDYSSSSRLHHPQWSQRFLPIKDDSSSQEPSPVHMPMIPVGSHLPEMLDSFGMDREAVTMTNLGDILDPNFVVIPFTPEERAARLSRYREKKARRIFGKKIRYQCRQSLAQGRPRSKGRFVKAV